MNRPGAVRRAEGQATAGGEESRRLVLPRTRPLQVRWYGYAPLRDPILAGAITAAAFALASLGVIPSAAEIALYVAAILLGGAHWIREGLEELMRERELGIEILMLAATVGSAVLGLWDEAAFLVFIYGAAEGLEEYTYARTRSSIRELLKLAPETAVLLRDGQELTVPAREVKVGDRFVVRPGEAIVTDAIIVRGRTSVNEAPVTGESVPVEKADQMPVFAGTINGEGFIEVEATATFESNTLAKIIHLVEEAQERKSRRQLFIERFGQRYSPAVFVTALAFLVIPYLIGGSPGPWAYRAVVLLVAAAPCALVMSTPVAIAAGIGRAGRGGVLVKGGVHLEDLGRVRAVALDKTGTLTEGVPVVTDVVAFRGARADVLRLAAGIERLSEHPLARAIVARARDELRSALPEVSEFEALTGAGVRGSVDGRSLYVGRPALLQALGANVAVPPEVERLEQEGKTVVLVASPGEPIGAIALRDQARSGAAAAIRRLHRMGVKVVMLTGDNEVTARAIATELGIDDVQAGLAPEDKIRAVARLEEEHGAVAMVGDGVNDAPALARATVGIAMGAAGTDAAIAAADVALMADDLGEAVYALELGRRVRRVSNQNIVFSILVLAVLIPLAVLGIMTVAVAVFSHETAELLAVANGLRAGRA